MSSHLRASAAPRALLSRGVACGKGGEARGEKHRAWSGQRGLSHRVNLSVQGKPTGPSITTQNFSGPYHPSVRSVRDEYSAGPAVSSCTRQLLIASQCFPPSPPRQELREPVPCATSVPSVGAAPKHFPFVGQQTVGPFSPRCCCIAIFPHPSRRRSRTPTAP